MNETSNYVRQDEHGVLRVAGTHVMLDSVLAAFEQGHSPETIRQQYPSLTLEEVYGAITYYLAHTEEVQEYLKSQDALWARLKADSEKANRAFLERLRALRDRRQSA